MRKRFRIILGNPLTGNLVRVVCYQSFFLHLLTLYRKGKNSSLHREFTPSFSVFL